MSDHAGSIFQINLSQGGVPKWGAHSAEVRDHGLVGDAQRDLELHGGPDRAVCLYSLEAILDLQTEGHPIFPGSIGENLTLSGLDWEQVVPGKVLRLGDEVVLEVTKYTSPCANLVDSFIGGKYERVSQKRYPGWSRLYARVLLGGSIHIGDRVKIE